MLVLVVLLKYPLSTLDPWRNFDESQRTRCREKIVGEISVLCKMRVCPKRDYLIINYLIITRNLNPRLDDILLY